MSKGVVSARQAELGHLRRTGRGQAVPSGVYRNGAGEAAGRIQDGGHAAFRATTCPTRSAASTSTCSTCECQGMLHGRVVRPRGQGAYGAGAKVLSVDESSIRDIPGARVVRKGDFIGVVAPNEWDAVRAAQQLKVTWDTTPSLPGSDGLYEADARRQNRRPGGAASGAMPRTRIGAAPHIRLRTTAARPINRTRPSDRTARWRT